MRFDAGAVYQALRKRRIGGIAGEIAGQRPTMRFVPTKTEEQLDLQAVRRLRERPAAYR